MNLTSLINDNISEILKLLIKFTQARQKLIIQNIANINANEYIPRELEVNEFSNLLNNAIDEHIRTNRLILCDTENIKFGLNGNFDAIPIEDEKSKSFFKDNKEQYIEVQIKKLWENSLNQKVAAELLKQQQEVFSDSC